jgi:hypothetical protein
VKNAARKTGKSAAEGGAKTRKSPAGLRRGYAVKFGSDRGKIKEFELLCVCVCVCVCVCKNCAVIITFSLKSFKFSEPNVSEKCLAQILNQVKVQILILEIFTPYPLKFLGEDDRQTGIHVGFRGRPR